MLLSHANYLLLATAGAIALLMLLIVRVRLHPALAILISAVGLGLASGMPLHQIPVSMTNGVGYLLGHVALVLALGAVVGHLLASSGGAAAVGEGLVARFGRRGLPFAMLLMGMLVGLPVFFEVGLVLLLPIVLSVARRAGRPAIVIGMPTLAGLSIVHGTIPPHPAAMLAVAQYHADLGRTILLGLAVGLPAALVAGPGYAWVYERWIISYFHKHAEKRDAMPASLHEHEDDAPAPGEQPLKSANTDAELRPGGLMAASLFILLLPICLIFLGSWADWLAPAQGRPSGVNAALHLAGDAPIALLVSALAALLLLGRLCGWSAGDRLRLTQESFAPMATVLMILAAAGGLSRILNDSGAAQATVELAERVHLSPLLLGWLLAATVRLAIGSATVAMAVTTGILAPVAMSLGGHAGIHTGFGAELLVLATGAGSLFCSHVNDPGFWMNKEFFGLGVGETLATWSVLETVLSVCGLAGTLALAAFLH